MVIFATVLHVVACLFLIGVVLLQQGKGADMGAVFGGSSSTIFGSGGAGNFLTRMTTAMAVIFMLTSLTLTYSGAARVTSTVFDDAPPIVAPAAEDTAPEAAVDPGAAAPVMEAPAAEAPALEAPAAEAPAVEAPAAEAPKANAPAAEPQAAVPEAAAQPEAAN